MKEHLHATRKRRKLHRKDSLLADRLIFAVGFLSPAMTTPQIWKIWQTQDAASISLFSWLAYLFFSTFWLYYGSLHKDRPIIFSSLCWITMEITVITQTLIYG